MKLIVVSFFSGVIGGVFSLGLFLGVFTDYAKSILNPPVVVVDVDELLSFDRLSVSPEAASLMFKSVERYLDSLPEGAIVLNKRIVVNDSNFTDITDAVMDYSGLRDVKKDREISFDDGVIEVEKGMSLQLVTEKVGQGEEKRVGSHQPKWLP